MRKTLFAALALTLALTISFAVAAIAAESIKMSTTTSTRDSGLLDYLLPEFTKDTGIEVLVLAKGTGAAIRDGIDGNVDVIFVHDPEREIQFVQDGWGTTRYEVMHNDFVLVGPAADPAGIKAEKDVYHALRLIAEKRSPFISRGDDSGTHAKELSLWKNSGLPMLKTEQALKSGGKERKVTFEMPQGDWYKSIGQGMGKTLIMAEEMNGYALADRGTFIQQKFGKTPPTSLEILVEGDKGLFNPYGVIPVNPAKYPSVKIKEATQFADWLVSERGQQIIARYQLQGKQLFFPDAIPDAK
ncbi:MAG: substrate-binding domain-containing protein [Deltaproteobacteria bacterium]|jgi:tungstate transport system substrate-binding protein|nr:substrate-binding domain-containing protein [Deltaproteobacteria bacterium]